ncbi:hypothetical protein [Bradyrhizobium lablabi]|uniref:hypothetical protein n=1 Tax=Bradyrhizobium lablabi TaxID=722472 RepID=UPI001BACF5C6|nr:hypothetical protein [Bradyrhizobium lablabi]MBR0696668.1 hypothetical protein [Bradyrhizobium lablabi]
MPKLGFASSELRSDEVGVTIIAAQRECWRCHEFQSAGMDRGLAGLLHEPDRDLSIFV